MAKRAKKQPPSKPVVLPRDAGSEAYRKHREQAGEVQREKARRGRDIGSIPPIVDPKRRKKGLASLEVFCRSYLATAFPWPFSDDHKKVIKKSEKAVTKGGNFAEAMPRGSGKSTLGEAVALWATLKGLRKFIALIGATADRGEEMVASINSSFENNDMLLEDFPEVVFPFRALEQSNSRAGGQRCLGELTCIQRSAGKLVFPTIAGSQCSGVVVVGSGIEGGRLRGLRHKLKDGTIIRPDLIICDDPQTDESALSIGESVKREKAITGKILGTAGPGMIPAAIVCGTVIRKGDMMDNLLDRQKHPEWQGERMKLLYAFPKDEKLWDEYSRLRAEELAADGDGSKATKFYRANRKAMDAGAIVAWKSRKGPAELSAIQHAMNLFFRDREVFFAEYQNEPVVTEAARRIMTPEEIAAKQNNRPRGEVPQACSHVTAFIDVHQDLLYWMVCAWQDDFTGYLLDYGTSPDQHRAYFLLREAKHTLSAVHKGVGLEAWIYAGLDALAKTLAEREFVGDGGVFSRVGKLGIDANWGQTTAVVKQFCRQSSHSAIIAPTHGHFFGAGTKPLSQYQNKPGDRLNREYNWYIPHITNQVRHVLFDTNWWKSFVHARLGTAMGDHGCLSLFASADHRLLADHLTAELPIATEGRGRKVDEWKLPPGRDNHWFDCLVGCAMLASLVGCRLPAGKPAPRPAAAKKRQAVSYL